MKLWQCDDCGGYYNKAYLTVPMSASCRLERNRAVFSDPDFEVEHSWSLDKIISTAECPECNGQLGIVEVDTCPHDWRKRYGDEAIRICRFCGERQRGVVTFPGS